ncbi:hypothetical protein [Candidatus Poriferisocius sp.]|uniref:hypothetical protein n=1 Tax=Candidatus Poriferisocius sp. TaxID=3101276 RepID=UPI003B595C26
MDDQLCGFLDESKKPVRDPRTRRESGAGDFYVVAAAVVLQGHLEETRSELRGLADVLGADLHYNELGRDRRIEAVERIDAIPFWDGYLFETAQPLTSRHNPERRLRDHTMAAAFIALGADEGVEHLVLETRGKPSMGFTQLDQQDHRVLQRLRNKKEVPYTLSISHETKTEPLLWLADVVAGARSDHLCKVYDEIYPLLCHRIRRVHSVLDR